VSPATVTIDFGSSHTVAVVSAAGRENPRLVPMDGEPWMPSAVFLDRDGRLVAGRAALRLAGDVPARLESSPKARVDEREVLLGDTVVPVVSLLRAVLAAAVDAAREAAGQPPGHLVLTHPQDWGPARLSTLLAAAQGLAPRTSTVPEPLAAASWFAGRAPFPVGQSAGVLDFGGGTCDASVVRRTETGLTVVGTGQLPDLGGQDLDQRLVDHLREEVPGLAEYLAGDSVPGRGRPSAMAGLSAFRTRVREAKERLSEHPQAEIALPGELPEAMVTRPEFDELIGADVRRASELMLEVIHSAGLDPAALAGLQLAGGSARIPLVARTLADTVGIPVRLDGQSEAVHAFGAHRVALEAERRAVPARGPVSAPTPAPAPSFVSGPGPAAGPVPPPRPVAPGWEPPRAEPRRRAGGRRAAFGVLGLGVVLLVAAVVAGFVFWPVVTPGTAGGTTETFGLPAPAPGGPLVTEGRPTDGLTPGRLGVPAEVVFGGLDVDLTVNAVTDPAGDKLNRVGGNADAGTDGRWVLVDTTFSPRFPASTPYLTKNFYLVNDRGLFIPPVTGAALPSDCPLETPPTLNPGQQAHQCYAFLISSNTPVTGVAVAGSTQDKPGTRQRGLLVPAQGQGNGEPKPSPSRIPAGTVRMVFVDGVGVRVAVVDAVRTPGAYYDSSPIDLSGSSGVLVRMVADAPAPVELTRLLGGVLLRDERRQYLAPSNYSSRNGCAPVKDEQGHALKGQGRMTLCLLFAPPTGMPLGTVIWSNTGSDSPAPPVWGLPGA
jgi:hypothetical protein